MTEYRPDLLPFALPDTLGLPFHGLVKNGDPTADPVVAGTLTLPSAATKSYPQPSDGATIMVEHPRHSAPARTAAQLVQDAASDYQWLEYALLSGKTRHIGGRALEEHHHLYCDANYTWIIRLALTSGTGTCTLRVYLKELFGLLVADPADYAFTERLLATYTWSPEDNNGNSTAGKTVGQRYLATVSKTGAKAILNVGRSTAASGFDVQVTTQAGDALYCHDVLRVNISGNGSIMAGSLGSGISATIDHVAWGDEMDETVITVDGSIETRKWLYVTTPNGTETNWQSVKEKHSTYEQIDLGGGNFYTAVTSTYIDTMSFGGSEYTNEFSYTGRYNHPDDTCLNEGTATINGVDEPYCSDVGTVPSPAFDAVGDATIETVLPLIGIVSAENKAAELFKASGSSVGWGETASQKYTHNAATDEVATNGDNYICYV